MEQVLKNKLTKAIFLFLLTVAYGFIGFRLIEHHTPLNSAYLAIITMSTVGFETIKPLTDNGKWFVISLILLSTGSFVYLISIMTTFVVEGHFYKLYYRFRMEKAISKLENHVIVCGFGRNGKEAVAELLSEKRPFLVIEKSESNFNLAQNDKPGFPVIIGDATEESVLRSANIASASALITSLQEDADNIFVTLTAKELKSEIVIVSRANHESTIPKLKRAGANHVILPNLIGGRRMARILTNPALIAFIEFISGDSNHDFLLKEYLIDNNRIIQGSKLSDLGIKQKTGAQVIGIQFFSGEFEINPETSTYLTHGDKLFVLGKKNQIQKYNELFEI
jgi:voltage-gated potassium channel